MQTLLLQLVSGHFEERMLMYLYILNLLCIIMGKKSAGVALFYRTCYNMSLQRIKEHIFGCSVKVETNINETTHGLPAALNLSLPGSQWSLSAIQFL